MGLHLFRVDMKRVGGLAHRPNLGGGRLAQHDLLSLHQVSFGFYGRRISLDLQWLTVPILRQTAAGK